ncbi:DUF309 domain-containing protein [Nakamurella deserti]|uniref:DUF309 domain-containing protein n=1 Tax=Nakamurella deserti TaxID=2164074 RepID=UPI000DBE109F|nr:DUF309 domain-containing protein [Nakamurella deserti]
MTSSDPAADRDRDDAGRARNSRPRDELGRPLPYGAVDVPRQPEGIVRTPRQTLDEAQELLDAGRPFHAHEVFEDAWKATDGPDRALWKALAQLAVGVTHHLRGNPRGSAVLIGRAATALRALPTADTHGVDVAGLLAWCDATAAGRPPAGVQLRGRAR